MPVRCLSLHRCIFVTPIAQSQGSALTLFGARTLPKWARSGGTMAIRARFRAERAALRRVLALAGYLNARASPSPIDDPGSRPRRIACATTCARFRAASEQWRLVMTFLMVRSE
jgi:hypothetical protein